MDHIEFSQSFAKERKRGARRIYFLPSASPQASKSLQADGGRGDGKNLATKPTNEKTSQISRAINYKVDTRFNTLDETYGLRLRRK